MCSYYDDMARQNPKCAYYPAAAQICRGQGIVGHIVNTYIGMGLADAYNARTATANESQILPALRKKLIAGDKAARAQGKTTACGCVKGDDIDAYHNKAFKELGIGQLYYGGNVWFQGVWPNPVPRGLGSN